jgi:molybdate transport system permease protein
LGRRRFAGRDLLEACANLPLLMPPAVLAYYLLAALGRWHLVFHWRAAVAVSAVYILPLLLRWPGDGGFENAARSLGAGEWRVLWRITLPLAWRGLLGAVLAGFARAAADFGITVMVAGQGASGWLLLPIGVAALAALYGGKRLRREWGAA